MAKSAFREAGSPRSLLLGFVDTQAPSSEFEAIELFYRRCHRRFVGKLNEGETSGTTGVAVGGNKDLNHSAHFDKKSFKLALCSIEAQVSDKNFADDNLLW